MAGYRDAFLSGVAGSMYELVCYYDGVVPDVADEALVCCENVLEYVVLNELNVVIGLCGWSWFFYSANLIIFCLSLEYF